MILTVTLNPTVDEALFVDRLRVGDTNRVLRVDRDAGGKGVNVARVIATLGGETLATGLVGGDPGGFVRQVLDAHQVAHDFLDVAGETRVNFSVEDTTKSPPTTFNRPGPTISGPEWSRFLDHFTALVRHANWVALCGSLPPGVPADAYAQLGDIAHAHGAKVAVDADGETLRLAFAARPDLIKPNEKEAARLLDREVETTEDCLSAAAELRRQCAEEGIVLLSRGGKGAVMASHKGRWVGESPKVEVLSTMGSGDSMVAGTLYALESGLPVEEAMAWGLSCGAATAATDGTKIAHRDHIMALLPSAVATPVT